MKHEIKTPKDILKLTPEQFVRFHQELPEWYMAMKAGEFACGILGDGAHVKSDVMTWIDDYKKEVTYKVGDTEILKEPMGEYVDTQEQTNT